MIGFMSFADLGATINRGIDRIPTGIDMVVGIPRSGMIPAYMIGLYCNISVLDLPTFLSGKNSEHGSRALGIELSTPMNARSILLVDDSLSSGASMQSAIDRIHSSGYAGKITTCAVVVEPSRLNLVDIYFCEMPWPRFFEWNAFYHPTLLASACFDLDGVLCADPTPEENDDGPRYLKFLQQAKLRFRSTYLIGDIVSARLEKYREVTEQWLAKNHVLYRNLHLIDLSSALERTKLKAHCTHKAKVYQGNNSVIFFESDPDQAAEISRLSSKPVLCTTDMNLYLPSLYTWPIRKVIKWKFFVPIGRVKARLRACRDLLIRP